MLQIGRGVVKSSAETVSYVGRFQWTLGSHSGILQARLAVISARSRSSLHGSNITRQCSRSDSIGSSQDHDHNVAVMRHDLHVELSRLAAQPSEVIGPLHR